MWQAPPVLGRQGLTRGDAVFADDRQSLSEQGARQLGVSPGRDAEYVAFGRVDVRQGFAGGVQHVRGGGFGARVYLGVLSLRGRILRLRC